MTQRRDIEARLELYDDLSGILGAMRSFALAELHKVLRREEAEHQVMNTLSGVMADVSSVLPPPAKQSTDVWLLFGSVRGFCGSFNEDVVRAWQENGADQLPTVVVGERLTTLISENISITPVSGAVGALDAPAVINRILAALNEVRSRVGLDTGLMACLRDEEGIHIQRLLPYPVTASGKNLFPLTNEAPLEVATKVADHYLFHSLLGLLLRSIRVENRMRLLQMENALQHLDKGSEGLKRQRNRLRQEEIVEEIELMARER